MSKVTTAHAIERFFADRSPGAIVSLADAITYVRLVNPSCELTDGEIASLIGWHADRQQCTLRFDLRERSPLMLQGWRSFEQPRLTAH